MHRHALLLTLAINLANPGIVFAGPEDCLRGKSRGIGCQQMLSNYWGHEQLITTVATRYGLEPALLKALVAIESGFNPNARSGANAIGLTQVIPSTARGIGLENPEVKLYQAEISLSVGASYLRQMWFEFRDWPLALAAYNAGPGAVRRHKGIPPYKETQAYVPKVMALYREFAIAEAQAINRH